MVTRHQPRTFSMIHGDHSTYQFGPDETLKIAVRREPFLACDIETGSAETIGRWKVKAVSFATPTAAWVLDPAEDREAIKWVLHNAKGLVFHNAPYDVPALCKSGFMWMSDIDKVDDTLLMARLSNPSDKGGNALGQCAERVLGRGYLTAKSQVETIMKSVTRAKNKSEVFDQLGLNSEAYIAYSAFDSLMTARLYDALPAQMEKHHIDHPYSIPQYATYKDIWARELTVLRVSLRRSCLGIKLAPDEVFDEVRGELNRAISIEDTTLAQYGVDISLTDTMMAKSLMRVLDAAGALPPKYTRGKDGSPSFAKDNLKRVSHPLIPVWQRRTESATFLHKFLDTFLTTPDDRIYPQINVAAAKTGRMSVSNPPLQQMPGFVRPLIRFDTPTTSFDWSAIEPVIIFNLSREIELIADFEQGGDIYLPIAGIAGVTRPVAKTVLLAGLYGQGLELLASKLVITMDEAKIIRDRVRAAMPKTFDLIRKITRLGDSFGRILTMVGRNIPVDPDPTWGNKRFKGYTGVNYVVQGGAYDLLAESIHNVERAGLGDAIVLAVHDELLVDTQAAEDVKRIMETPPPWFIAAAGRTPVLRVGRTDMGTTWLNKP